MEELPLSREDRAILELESPTVVGHTCKVLILEEQGPSVAELRESIAARIDAAPELRRRLGGTEKRPVWVAAPDFELADHVGSGGSAADPSELRAVVSGLFAQPLDRDRPLWRLDRIALGQGGQALVWRIHHALADGTAAMRIGSEAIWAPAATAPAAAAKSPGSRGPDHRDEERRRGHLAAFLRREFADSAHVSPFDGEVGSRRSVAFAEAPLRPLHDAAKRLAGATVNDAVLSVVAGAIRRWLEAEHGRLDTIRLRVPVSLHHEGDDAGNRDSFFTLPAPISEPDPVRRLERIHAATLERKTGHDAERLESLLDSLGSLSERARRFAERLEASPRSFALSVSNVRGPSDEIAVCDAGVRSLFSLAEVGRRHGLRASTVSLGERMGFGFCADPTIVPDVELLGRGLEAEVSELLAAAA